MRRLTSSWNNLLSRLGLSGRKSRSPKRKPMKDRRLQMESLEVRQLLTILYWDPNGSQGAGGSGTWDSSTACWNTSPNGTGTLQTWQDGSDAVFSGTAGAVAVSGQVSPRSITFNTTAYALQGGAVAMPDDGATIDVPSGSATISSPITGEGGLTKTGEGTLILGGESTHVAPTMVQAGTLDLEAKVDSYVQVTGGQVIGPGSPLTTQGIADVEANSDSPATTIDLGAAFSDQQGLPDFSIENDTNPGLFSSTVIDPAAGTLTLAWAAGQSGEADVTVRATAPEGLFLDTTFHVTLDAGTDQLRSGSGTSGMDGSGSLQTLSPMLSTTTLYWDPDGNASGNNISTGAGLGGASGGTWATGSGNYWYNPTTQQDGAWIDGSNAAFFGTAGPVTISGTVAPSAITFMSNNYAVQGGQLSLASGGTTIDVTANNSATISSQVSGSTLLTKLDAGTLTLAGTANNYTGGTEIDGGTLKLGSNSALGAQSGSLVLHNSGSTLDLNGHNTSVTRLNNVAADTGTVITDTSGTTHTLTVYGVSSSNFDAYWGTIQGSVGLSLAPGSGFLHYLTLYNLDTASGPTQILDGTSP
jgi:autotransporter-associated beta strand protein